jgi:predicted MFS family arabinose efflux permease
VGLRVRSERLPLPAESPSSTGQSPDHARTPTKRPPRELALLLTLATIQFTHVVDFMIMMPLGPQLMRLFDIGPTGFSALVSAYTFAAAASGFVAAFWIDRFDRKRSLLVLYAGFVVATALCGIAPNYEALLAARVAAGAFGGLIGALVLAIVADAVPYARRAQATALVGAAFALSSIAGVPLGLWLAARYSWRAPFLAVALASVVVGLVAARVLPTMGKHLVPGHRRHPVEQLRVIFGVRNHRRAFALMITLTFAGFTVIPFIAPYNVANVGLTEQDLSVIYFAGGLATLVTAQVFGWLADRHGKARMFTLLAALSIVPILITTHLPPLPLAAVVPFSTLFFILVTGRFGPAMALITGSVEPRLRGSFMSFNASVQQVGSGLAVLASGLIIGRASDGSLTRFGWVGWLAVAFTLLTIALARRIRVVDDTPVATDRGGTVDTR